MQDDQEKGGFAGEPDEPFVPLDDDERADVQADLEDLEVFQALLGPRGVKGLVVDCEDCSEPHYFGWDLLRGNLLALLDDREAGIHEPAFDPDPSEYVPWEYAHGFVDGVLDGSEPE